MPDFKTWYHEKSVKDALSDTLYTTYLTSPFPSRSYRVQTKQICIVKSLFTYGPRTQRKTPTKLFSTIFVSDISPGYILSKAWGDGFMPLKVSRGVEPGSEGCGATGYIFSTQHLSLVKTWLKSDCSYGQSSMDTIVKSLKIFQKNSRIMNTAQNGKIFCF